MTRVPKVLTTFQLFTKLLILLIIFIRYSPKDIASLYVRGRGEIAPSP